MLKTPHGGEGASSIYRQTEYVEPMEIKVIRSPKRKKTVQARVVGETLLVYLPVGMRAEEERAQIETIKERIEKKRLKREINRDDYLEKKFDEFNIKYFRGKLKINSLEFVTNQERRRGSCTPARGTIRISHKLLDMPRWVLDYVIMHEMTHLVHPDHSKDFWSKVNEYPYTERARGFLMARGMEEEEDAGYGN